MNNNVTDLLRTDYQEVTRSWLCWLGALYNYVDNA